MARKWIGRFEPSLGVVCSGFHRLAYVAACPHGCSYCFLESTYSRFGRPADATEGDIPEIVRQVERWMKKPYVLPQTGLGHGDLKFYLPSLLNAGELSDSFAPEISLKVSLALIELFRKQDRHMLLLVSKAMPLELAELPPDYMRTIEPTSQVILSFSAPDTKSFYFPRPEVGYLDNLMNRGWRVRMRFDPLVEVASGVYPFLRRYERITVGTLRATAANYRRMKNGDGQQAALADQLVRDPNGGSHPYRLPVEKRVAIYKHVAEVCGRAIGLCKEVPQVYSELGWKPEANRCNCAP